MRAVIFLFALAFATATLAPVPGATGTAAPSSIELSSQNRAPSPSCERDRKACMAGSVRTGNFGVRYVPPDAAAACHQAYRSCIGQR